MYLQQVKIKNFRGFGENKESEDKCFTFDRLDSDFVIFNGFNGFGKTSFFESIEWCLTDSVKRLEKYIDNYNANELKRSHHLKFHHPNSNDSLDREIYVELTFSNNLQVIRTSSSISHKFGNEDNYSSDLIVKKDGIIVDDHLKYFSLNGGEIEQFLNTHFLGQESINSFLRGNSPEERKSIFMELLNLNKLNQTYQEVSNLNRSRKFSTKLDKLNQKVENNNALIQKINTYMTAQGYDSVNDYINKMNLEFTKLKDEINKENLNGLLGGNYKLFLNQLEEIKVENCFKFLLNTEKEHKLIQEKSKEENEMILEHRKHLNSLDTIEFLEYGRGLISKRGKYTFLKNNDYEEVINEIEENKAEISGLSKKNNKYELEIEKLNSLKFKLSVEDNLDIVNNKILNIFWESINKLKEKSTTVIKEFNDEISKLGLETNLLSSATMNFFYESKKSYEKLQSERVKVNENIESKEKDIKYLTSVGKQLSEMLNMIKSYIYNNEIEKCPVCLNEDFTETKYYGIVDPEADNKEKIISIINNTLTQGNSKIAEINAENATLYEEKEQIEKNIKQIISRLTKEVEIIMSNYEEFMTRIENSLLEKLRDINSKLEVIKTKNEKISTNKITLDRIYKELINEIESLKKDVSIIDLNIQQLNLEIDKWIKDSKQTFYTTHPELSELQERIQEKKIEFNYNETSSLDEQKNHTKSIIKQQLDKLKICDSLLLLFKGLLKYKLPEEFDDNINKYYFLETEKGKVKKEIDSVEGFKEELRGYSEDLHKQRNIAIEEKLERHPIIGWIYESINPHPFYRHMIITNDGRGANFKDKTRTLYLDHIFSSAQLNILALSIFMGLGLSVDDNLNQLFLDDPIQSMDDVNILALIDIFRGLMDSKFKNKKLIISTHDSNFAKLISIKMRNRDIVQYNFISYNDEGPVIHREN